MVTSDSVQVGTTVDSSRTAISKDWSRLATDDGAKIIENHDYAVRLISRSGEVIVSEVTTLRFRDEVSTSQNPQFNIPPTTDVTDNITNFLNGSIQFFVDGDIAFAGDIIKVNSSQKEGDDITVKARSPGRRLVDQSVDITPDNDVIQDVMASIVDKQNTFHEEYDAVIGSASFNGTTTIGDVTVVQDGTTSGTVMFSDVASNASEIEYINVKCYTSPSATLTLIPDDANEDDFVHQMDSLDANRFGEWKQINIPSLPNVSYDIEFELQGDSTLMDWIVITSDDVTRDVTPPEITQVGSSNFLYSRSGSQLDSNLVDDDSQSVVYDSDLGGMRGRQVGVNNPIDGVNSDSEAVDGQVTILSPGDQTDTHTLQSKDTIVDGIFWARLKPNGDFQDSTVFWDVNVIIDGSTTDTNASLTANEWTWVPLLGNLSDATSKDFALENRSENSFNVNVDVFWWGNSSGTDHYNDPFFHNDVDENQQLQGPREYIEEAWVTFTSEAASENITGATTTTTLQNTTPVEEPWGPVQRLTQDIPFPNLPNNSNTVSNTWPFTGVEHQVRVYVGASGFRENETPQFGYQSVVVTDYSVDVTTNDLEIMFDQNVTGNRLQSISELADSSTQSFRWDGNECKIFQRGTRSTDVNLRKEEASSSVGIEDVYTSAEVYGEGGVYSGVVEADDPPDFVDRNKEIRDADILTENDAQRRAISFLRNNSNLEYEGTIRTLPTLAPVGEMIDGSVFSHGQDMVIESVRYSKSRTTIQLGFTQRLARKIRGLDQKTTALTRTQTTQ